MDCPVAAPIVIAIKVKGLKLSGALRAVIISRVGLHCPRSSFEMYVRLLTSARFFWESPRMARVVFSTEANADLSDMYVLKILDFVSDLPAFNMDSS